MHIIFVFTATLSEFLKSLPFGCCSNYTFVYWLDISEMLSFLFHAIESCPGKRGIFFGVDKQVLSKKHLKFSNLRHAATV